jgi:MFS family permease
MILFDKNNNTAIILAGIISIFIGMGVSRFAFTSLLPFMLEDFLNLTFTGYLASVNFIGYLSGVIFAVFLKDIYKKVFYFRIGLILSLITTLALSISQNETIWLISRVVAGFGAAMVFMVGSSIVMLKLNFKNKTKAMGIYFSGLGISILLSDLIIRVVIYLNYSWSFAWFVLFFIAFILCGYSIYILTFEKNIKNKPTNTNKPIFSIAVIILMIAYFTEGIGYVIQATFLPDIINSIAGLEGYGGYTWTIVGLSAIISTISLLNLAHKYGSVNIIILAMLLQVIGILIPTLTQNIYINLLSGALYGSTFAGLVALFLNLGGKLSPHNPVILMATLTTIIVLVK